MNVRFWQDWFKWVQIVILSLSKKGDFLGLATFLGEVGTTIESLVAPLEGLSECFRGGFFSILGRLYSWAKSNPDPLANFRHAAVALKKKWGAPPAPANKVN